MLAEILSDLLVALLGPVFGPEDFHRDGPPGSSHWLRKRNRYNVVLRQLEGAASTDGAPGVSRRWHRFVIEVRRDRSCIRYRRRWRPIRHIAPAPAIRRSDVRLPGRHETSKFRQIFAIRLGTAACEIGIWSREVRRLKEGLDAAASSYPRGR